MLRVSVAEDNPKDRERLLSFLKKYGEEKDVQIEVKRQKHQYKDRYGNPPSAAVPYPVCGGGTASLDLPHRGRGFFHKRCSEGC